MTLFNAIIFGIIQGATEFLPVSSSGHLFLAEKILGTEAGMDFFIWLHVGTLFAVTVFYRKTLLKLAKNPKDHRVFCLFLASVPTFLIAVAWKLLLPENAEYLLLPFGFLATFLLLLFFPGGNSRKRTARERSRRTANQRKNATPSRADSQPCKTPENGAIKPVSAMKAKDALIVGAVQGLAVIPGLSRSGSTITALRFLGFKQEEAGEFSFLLSIPVISGGAVADVVESLLKRGSLLHGQALSFNQLSCSFNELLRSFNELSVLLCERAFALNELSLAGMTDTVNKAVAVVLSGIVGFLALKVTENLIKSGNFRKFAWYLPVPMLLSVLLA